MDKNSINRLTHTLVPFIIMAMVQRLLILIYGHFELYGRLAELLAFLPAVGIAVLLFRVKTYHICTEEEHTEIKPLNKKNTLFSCLQLLITMAVMILLMYATSSFASSMAYSSTNSTELSLLTVVSTLIIHPFLEEYLFRYLFYGELRLLNPIFGCMMQAVMFAIIHNTVESMTYALISAVALAILYEQTGAMWTVISAHIFINLRSLLYLTFLAGNDSIIRLLDTVFIAIGGLAFVFLGITAGSITASRITANNEDDSENDANGDSDA